VRCHSLRKQLKTRYGDNFNICQLAYCAYVCISRMPVSEAPISRRVFGKTIFLFFNNVDWTFSWNMTGAGNIKIGNHDLLSRLHGVRERSYGGEAD
jgi:hypothetical protein